MDVPVFLTNQYQIVPNYLFAAMETGRDLCCGPRRTGGFSRKGLFWCRLVSIERRRISRKMVKNW